MAGRRRQFIAFVFLSLGIFLFTVPTFSKNTLSSYAPDFIWGAAFSAHQTEGVTGGGENGDWYQFEHPTATNSPIANGDTADVADDEWNRYEEDIVNAKKLGLTSLRTSIAWEKVEPTHGVFSTAAADHYHQVFAKMKELGIRPLVCLYHFTEPTWFNSAGGWTSANSPTYFLEYAKFIVSNLSDVVDFWITFNEPMITVQMGYLKGEVPPRKPVWIRLSRRPTTRPARTEWWPTTFILFKVCSRRSRNIIPERPRR